MTLVCHLSSQQVEAEAGRAQILSQSRLQSEATPQANNQTHREITTKTQLNVWAALCSQSPQEQLSAPWNWFVPSS